MKTANEKIQDRTIRRMVYLERYKANQTREIRRKLNREILPEIRSKIEGRVAKINARGSNLGKANLNRLTRLEIELKALSDKLAESVMSELTGDAIDFTRDEVNWQVQTIRDELGVNISFTLPDIKQIARITQDTSFSGLTLDRWFDTLSTSTQRGVMVAVNRGIVEGETTAQIMRRIRGSRASGFTDGVFETTRRQAETIARTTINHASNQTRTELFRENADIIAGLKWTATLDSRTSLICAGLDGRVFAIDKGPRPPAHPNCRSTMTAVLKDAAALGLNDLPEATRASIDGQVPVSTTYGEWLRGQSKEVQQGVLGVKKARLFRDGKLPIDRFTDSTLQPLNLTELRALEEKAFNRANIDL